jgi:hypothetical protein
MNLNPEKKLARPDWDDLNIQFSVTPDPDEGFTETGEHMKLISLLNRLGYYPFSRKEAVRLAQKLLDAGYEPDEAGAEDWR